MPKMGRKRRHKTDASTEDLNKLEPCRWATAPENYYSPSEVEARENCKALIEGTLNTDAYLSFHSLFGEK